MRMKGSFNQALKKTKHKMMARLTLPMLRLLSSKAQGCKDFWKFENLLNRVIIVFIRQLSLRAQNEYKYARISIIFIFLAVFCIDKISQKQHKD